MNQTCDLSTGEMGQVTDGSERRERHGEAYDSSLYIRGYSLSYVTSVYRNVSGFSSAHQDFILR